MGSILHSDIRMMIEDAIEIEGPMSRAALHDYFASDHNESELNEKIDQMLVEGQLVLRREDSRLYLPYMVFADPGDAKDLPEVYLERNLLAMAFIDAYIDLYQRKYNIEPEHGWWDNGDDPGGMRLVWTETEAGQVAWHVPEYWVPDSFPRKDPEYNGYSDGVKNDRVRMLAGVDEGVVPDFLPNMDPGGAMDARHDS